MRQVRCGDFQLAVCRLDLVVDSRDIVKVVDDIGVGPEEVDDVQNKFRITGNAKTWRTAKYLSEIHNRLKLGLFVFSSGLILFLGCLA